MEKSKNNRETLIEDLIFAVFDTETTGDNTKRADKPIEVAAVRWNMNKSFLEIPKSWMVDPEMSIHPSAIAVHGIEDEDVKGKPLLDEILPEFLEYIDDSVLVAHNIDFDLNMLPVLKNMNNQKLDTLRFARQIFKIGDIGYKGHDLRSHKSQELRYWLGIKIDTMGLQAHRAAADILVTGEVFNHTLKPFLERTNAKTLGELLDFINAPIMVEKMTFGKFKDRLVSEAVAEEAKNPKNYFAWLLRQVHKGEMKIDQDLKHTIEHNLRNNDIDPIGILIEEPVKDWKSFSNALKKK
jgi:DNA polymerase III epsilon subunit family exonuclease